MFARPTYKGLNVTVVTLKKTGDPQRVNNHTADPNSPNESRDINILAIDFKRSLLIDVDHFVVFTNLKLIFLR